MTKKCAPTKPWSVPTTPEEVRRRAEGRKHYNAVRRMRADYRRYILIPRMLAEMDRWFTDRGLASLIAPRLGVSRWTAGRDLRHLQAEWLARHRCPACGAELPLRGYALREEVNNLTEEV